MGRRAQVGAGLYVAVVAVLTGASFRDAGQGFSAVELAALVMLLPAVVVALPLIYLVGAGAWSLTDAGDGGPMWPVTVVFVVMFVGVAVANLWLLRRLLRRLVRVRT
jgi:hypothetical protein